MVSEEHGTPRSDPRLPTRNERGSRMLLSTRGRCTRDSSRCRDRARARARAVSLCARSSSSSSVRHVDALYVLDIVGCSCVVAVPECRFEPLTPCFPIKGKHEHLPLSDLGREPSVSFGRSWVRLPPCNEYILRPAVPRLACCNCFYTLCSLRFRSRFACHSDALGSMVAFSR